MQNSAGTALSIKTIFHTCEGLKSVPSYGLELNWTQPHHSIPSIYFCVPPPSTRVNVVLTPSAKRPQLPPTAVKMRVFSTLQDPTINQ